MDYKIFIARAFEGTLELEAKVKTDDDFPQKFYDTDLEIVELSGLSTVERTSPRGFDKKIVKTIVKIFGKKYSAIMTFKVRPEEEFPEYKIFNHSSLFFFKDFEKLKKELNFCEREIAEIKKVIGKIEKFKKSLVKPLIKNLANKWFDRKVYRLGKLDRTAMYHLDSFELSVL
jgi:hypothetical protein